MGAFYTNMIKWLETHVLTCPVKKFFHIDCPGCGLQRSFIALLKGNLSESFYLHPATIPLLAFFIFAILQLSFKFKNGNRIIVAGYIFVCTVVLCNYVYKIIDHRI
jgi:hypothetical protein